jgi:hypothetical protein
MSDIREKITEKLFDWQSGSITEVDLKDWAASLYMRMEATDFDDDGNSVSNEVLSMLESLDLNLILKEDIPAFLSFLKTPVDQFSNGYAILDAYFNAIDYDARKLALRSNAFYSIYCK